MTSGMSKSAPETARDCLPEAPRNLSRKLSTKALTSGELRKRSRRSGDRWDRARKGMADTSFLTLALAGGAADCKSRNSASFASIWACNSSTLF